MGKNSARSKGYRKTYKKVSGYTEKEKKILTIGFLAIVVALILVLVVPDFIESLSLIGRGDNWIVGNISSSYSEPKYRKLGEANAIEGYELSEVQDGPVDDNIDIFVFTPTGDSPAQKYSVQTGTGEADYLVDRYRGVITSYANVAYMDETVHEETVNGIKTYSFVMEYSMENFTLTDEDMVAEEGSLADILFEDPEPTEAPETDEAADAEPAEELPPLTYTQAAVLYADCNVDDMCILIMAVNEGYDDTVFSGDRAALHELALKAVEGLSLD